MSAIIKQLSFCTVRKPMRTTFVTALGSKSVATSVLVTVGLKGGLAGVGEVPTSFVMPHETVAAISAILREARGVLVGRSIEDYQAVLAGLRKSHESFHMTLAGLEVALFRAALAWRGQGELAHWGGKNTRIETDITIPFLPDLVVLRAWLAKIAPVGFNTYKVKVSGKVPQDLTFVKAIHQWLSENCACRGRLAREVTNVSQGLAASQKLGIERCRPIVARPGSRKREKTEGETPSGRMGETPMPRKDAGETPATQPATQFTIRLDGNQGYTAASAMRMLEKLDKARIGVELFEQPLHKDDHAGLRELTACCPVPVILDETVFEPDQCRHAIEHGLGHGVNIKIAKSGIARSAAILKLARRAKWKLMIGCMTETLTGLSAGINMAAGTGAFDYIDLDSAHLLSIRRACPGLRCQGPVYLLEDRSC